MFIKQAFFDFKNIFIVSICQDGKLGYYCNLGDGHELHSLMMA